MQIKQSEEVGQIAYMEWTFMNLSWDGRKMIPALEHSGSKPWETAGSGHSVCTCIAGFALFVS